MPGVAARSPPPRRKRFGQHFLHDPAIIARIVHAIGVHHGDHLVEIGPGRGALTAPLLAQRPASLDAIEIDRDLAALLGERFAATPGWTLHRSDALQFDYAALARARGAPLRIVGNLPYNISTPLLFGLLAAGAAIRDLTIMLQREVAARLAARPGDAGYGRLTVMLAPFAAVSWLFDVGPGAFQPPPRVWSAVLRLTMRAQPAFAVSPHYAAVVSAAFAQRRKTLRNALAPLLTREQISACGIDPGVRPERLAAEGFNTLARALDRAGGGG